MSWLNNKNKKSFFNSFGGRKLLFSLIILSMFFMAVPAFAEHIATITIDPDMANCDDLDNKFTVNVENSVGSGNQILQVEILEPYVGISEFSCGPAPGTEWSLQQPYIDRCIYIVSRTSSERIAPGENLDFTFEATMEYTDACASNFYIATVDDEIPEGDRDTTELDVKIDCTAPDVVKTVGEPKISGAPDFNWWITQNTNINVLANDNADFGQCDLGLDYCQYTYTVDGGSDAGFASECAGFSGTYYVDDAGVGWCKFKNGPTLDFDFLFNEDSVHDIAVECYDVVGNKTTITETDRVDSTDPKTTKIYYDPYYPEGINEDAPYPHWISTSSLIELNAIDQDPTGYSCNIGVTETWYLDELVPEEACLSPGICQSWAYDMQYDGEWQLYEEPFTKNEESCHILLYYSIDELGNTEEMNYQCVFVDNTPPELWKVHGDGMIEDSNKEFITDDNPDGVFHWMTQKTPIDLYCNDTGDHPVNNVSLWYRVWDDLSSQWTDWVDPVGEPEAHKTIYFTEDSVHKLQYYCEDALGNSDGTREEPYMQIYRVDSTPPEITKEMIGDENVDWLGDCPPQNENDKCYVADNNSGGVSISVTDLDTTGMGCNIGVDYCNYGLWWFTSEEICNEKYPDHTYSAGRCAVDSGSFSDYKEIIFYEDSRHDLYINCWDELGNTVSDVETFLVDSTPPVTTKEYGEPYKVDPECMASVLDECEGNEECIYNLSHTYCTWWITSQSPVTLTAEDEKVGTEEIYWRNLYFPDNDEICHLSTAQVACVDGGDGCPPTFCHPDYYYSQYIGEWPEWNNYSETGPFTKEPESCHVIEYYSIDSLGNEEDMKYQCVFVDNSPPESFKRHGEPLVEDDGFDWVTTKTPMWLTCEDQDPHPVGQETLWWRFSKWTDGFEGEPEYSEWYSEDYTGFPIEVYFPDDCWHDLEYYCVDHLGNDERTLMEGLPHTQYYIVDTVGPVIEKEIAGPNYPEEECPPESEEDICFINGVTEIHVNAYDPDPHPINGVTCEWSYDVYEGDYWIDSGGSEGEVTPPFVIHFPEESTHVLTITCEDELGNTTIDKETFYVDYTPPGIWKKYGYPYEQYEFEDYWAEWISSDTEIYAGATDDGTHKSGIKEVKYRTTKIDDEYCKYYYEEDGFDCQYADGNGSWTFVDPEYFSEFEFDIPDDSCHLIEITATDNVDKFREHKQCVFVDNQAPDPVKEVGEPKEEWDGMDAVYYDLEEFCSEPGNCWKVTLLTPITLECVDPEPHPVNHNMVYFYVELDGDDVTEYYCDEYGGDYNANGDGFCKFEEELEEFYFFEETEHNLKYYCEDALYNRGPIDDEKFKVEGTAFEIQLNKKWNLISVPFVLIDDSIENTFSEIAENIESVWTYDAFTDQWYVYHPNGEAPSNLDFFTPGWGYWIRMHEKDTLLLGGSLFSPQVTPPTRNLKEGWNLIGYYGTEGEEGYYGPEGNGEEAGCALFSLGDSYLDKGWTSLLTYWEPDNPDQWHEYDYYDDLDPGAGYWISVPEDELYSYTTNCGGFW